MELGVCYYRVRTQCDSELPKVVLGRVLLCSVSAVSETVLTTLRLKEATAKKQRQVVSLPKDTTNRPYKTSELTADMTSQHSLCKWR